MGGKIIKKSAASGKKAAGKVSASRSNSSVKKTVSKSKEKKSAGVKKAASKKTDVVPEKSAAVAVKNVSTPKKRVAVYDESQVRHLDALEHIRLRSGMYIGRLGDGSNQNDGIYVLLKEVVDNAVDRKSTRLNSSH